MHHHLLRLFTVATVAATVWPCLPVSSGTAHADYGWEGRRRISYQYSKDLFYNQYVGPGPGGVPAEMYVSPMPVPEHVGHTWGTYQPFYPHEYLYRHHRSWYNYHPGAGWTRTKVRYRTGFAGWADDFVYGAAHVPLLGSLIDHAP